MKRIKELGGALVAAAALCITSAAFLPAAANAAASGPSTWCTDGIGGETVVTNSPIAVAVEYSEFPDHSAVLVCWSTTPRGSSAPEANGGHIAIRSFDNGTTSVTCAGDRTPDTVLTLDCHNAVSVTDHNSASVGGTVTGYFQEGPAGPLLVAETGAEAGQPNGTNASWPFYRVDQSGSCLWVLGSQLLPGCNSATVELFINTNYWGDTVSGTSGTQCLVHNGSTCALGIPREYVKVGADQANPNIQGTVAGQVVYFDVPYTCVGFC